MNRAFVLLMAAAASLPAQVASNPVTFERMLNAAKEPQNWLNYSGSYMSQRLSLIHI